MLKNKVLTSIFLIIFIDLLGFSLILPLLPYLARTYKASDFEIGLLVAIYAAAQLVSAPILGRLSDKYGRRPLLILSIAGTLIGYLVLAFANSLWMIFLARLIDGLTAGNISIAQAYITDVTDAKNRARGLGMIGAAFGLGFIIGPATGGALSAFGFMVPALVAAALAAINLVLVSLWLPESLTVERRKVISDLKRPTLSPRDLFVALRRPQFGPLLHTRFFFGLAFSIFQTIFSLYALERFNLNAQYTGYILAYVGLLSVITQGFLIGRLTARFSEPTLIFIATGVMSASLLGWALAPNLITLLIILAPTSFSGGILNTVINSAITKSVTPAEIGGALGLSASIESATRVIAPSLGGLLLDAVGQRFGPTLGTSAPGIFATFIMAWLTYYVWRHIYRGSTVSTVLAANPNSGD
jgi:MFS transporter, DHA1 family, tetracycline resistance protein